MESEVSEKDTRKYGETAPFGNYVFAKCLEGNFAWIQSSVLGAHDDSFDGVLFDPESL